MNGYSQQRLLEWGKKHRLYLLAGLYIFCFCVSGIISLMMFVMLWQQVKVAFIIFAICLPAALILRTIVNYKERAFKEADEEISEKFQQDFKNTSRNSIEELNWRWSKYNQFVTQGVDPYEAYRRANQLEYSPDNDENLARNQ